MVQRRLWSETRETAGVPRTGVLTQHSSSISQLYAQADAVNPWFQNLVRSWASQVSDDAAAAWKHVPNKKPQRSFEKIRRSYGGRVSRLCDIVRASIVCDTIAQVCEALHVIAGDPNVRIMRGKQRFDAGYDGAASAGYRDFQLSLVVTGAAVAPDGGASAAECRRHIVEMQIHLREIYDQKTKADSEVTEVAAEETDGATKAGPRKQLSGHQRYTAFRTIMAK